MLRFCFIAAIFVVAGSLNGVSPTVPMGNWYSGHFEFNEDPGVCQQLMQTMTLEGDSTVLDLSYVDGTLYNDCLLNSFSYQGESPYLDAVIRSAGVANLLDPFVYFDLGTTYDWVVCIGLAGFFPQGTEAVFVDNLKRHATSGIVVTWFARDYSSPFFINPRMPAEVESFFLAQGMTRDLATENLLRLNANPLNFWPQILYVFRP